MASFFAKSYGFEVEWFEPELGDRGVVFDRDYRLVEEADRIEAFFEDETMPGGTGHVVDAALARSRPVYAWLVGERGHLTRIGEWENEEELDTELSIDPE